MTQPAVDGLARERTDLAWQRTFVATGVCALAVLRLAIASWAGVLAGAVTLIACTVVALMATHRRRLGDHLRSGADGRMPALLAALVGAICALHVVAVSIAR